MAYGIWIEPYGERDHQVGGASTDLSLDEEEIIDGRDLGWAGFVPDSWRIVLQWGAERIERTIRLADGDDELVTFR